MAYAERVDLIRKIEEERGSRVVTYFMSDRRTEPADFALPALKTALATEAQPFLYEILREEIGRTERLDLFLYTRGGQTDSVWPLVSLFRKLSKHFTVLVPFRAHSAGTLICLGADEIVMGEAAELSPVDPTTGNQFNPRDEVDKSSRRGISVEDVTSYIDLAKDESKVGLAAEESIAGVFAKLSDSVHPLALGNVNRVHNQIRLLANKLLELHVDDETVIEKAVDGLTRLLYSHTHAINPEEAAELLGDGMVVEATEREQGLLWELQEEYCSALHMHETLCRDEVVDRVVRAENHSLEMELVGAFIECASRSRVFRSKFLVRARSKVPSGVQLQIPPGQGMQLVPGLPVALSAEILSMGWKLNEDGV